MTENQPAVNAIREGWKTEERVKYTFRTKQGRAKEIIFSWDQVEGADVRVLKNRGWIVIAREIIHVTVGTTPESEQHIGGYGE